MNNYREACRRIREKFNTKYLTAQERAEARREEVRRKIPEIAVIDKKLSSVGSEIMFVSFSYKDDMTRAQKIEEIRKENEQLQEARRCLLVAAGYPCDYTDVKYDCNICEDSGYVDSKMCRCMKSELIMAGYEASGISHLLGKQTFENFSLDYYEGRAKEIMSNNLAYLDIYSKNFSTSSVQDSDGIAMFGGTGLGKTHLSSAVARRVIEKGYYVVYVSAVTLFEEYGKKTFSASRNGETSPDADRYTDCDLLIIDDLGTELKNQFTVSVLYNLLNTRMNLGKQTIISTNLSTDEFRTKYDDRIFSRIFGEFTIMPFIGEDIRMKKRRI